MQKLSDDKRSDSFPINFISTNSKKTKQNKKSHTPRNSTGLILMFVDNDYVSRFWQIIHFICCLEGKWS